MLLFSLTSMFGIGLSLTIPQITEPLRAGRTVIFELLANFVLVPALAFMIRAVIPLMAQLLTSRE